MVKPMASLSLDLDNQWAYLMNHGGTEWENYPTYLPTFVPYVLDVFQELDLKITFFIVGRDAMQEENKEYLKMIAQRGHEIANHSFKHETWLHKYSREAIEDEIEISHDLISKVTGKKPIGFRGPGFSWSCTVMQVLADKGYVYDSSTFPTFIGPIARKYYLKSSKLTEDQKKKRGDLYGKFSDGFRKLRPFFWPLQNRRPLLEIPVTTMPIFRIPMHMSYLIFLAGISPLIMKAYFNLGLLLCKLTGTRPNFLIHPTDLMGNDKISGMDFFPGMSIPTERKLELFKMVITSLGRKYTLVTMEDHALEFIKTQRKQYPENEFSH